MLLVLVFSLVFAGLKAWFAERQTLVLRITQRGDPIINKGHVELVVKDVQYDEDGCITWFTVCEQSVKVEVPQAMWPYVREHTKREAQAKVPPAVAGKQ
jgi:hypothetical protein